MLVQRGVIVHLIASEAMLKTYATIAPPRHIGHGCRMPRQVAHCGLLELVHGARA